MADNLPQSPDRDAEPPGPNPEASGQTPRAEQHSDGEALRQSELDALISSLQNSDSGEDAAVELAATPVHAETRSDPVDQSDMDAFIASILNDQDDDSIEVAEDAAAHTSETPVAEAAEAAVPSPPSEAHVTKTPYLIAQDELDALLAESQARFSAEDEAAGPQGRISEDLMHALSEEEIPQDVSGVPAGDARKSQDEMVASALLSQEELDALFARAEAGNLSAQVQSAETEAPKVAPVSVNDSTPKAAGSPLLSQNDLDALLAEMNATAGSDEGEAVAARTLDENENVALDQSEMDALIRQMTNGAAEVTPEEDITDQADMDTLLAQVDKTLMEEDDSLTDKVGEELRALVGEQGAKDMPPADVPTEQDGAVETVETLTEDELDKVLSGEDSEEPLDAQTLDKVLPESEAGAADMDALLTDTTESGVGQSRDDAIEPVEVDVPAIGADVEEASETLAHVAALEDSEDNTGIGSENLAAAGTVQEGGSDTDEAAQEAIDALLNKPQTAPRETAAHASDASPGAPETTVAATADSELPAVVKRKRSKRFTLPRMPKLPGVKTGASLAAGLVFGVACYLFLSSYETQRPVLEVPDTGKTQDLAGLLERARTLLDAGDFQATWRMLEGPVREAPPSPLRTDAERVRIEAAYRSLPPRPAPFDAELVNSYIDTFLARAGSHPDVPRILEWKADLYERAGIPYAAYDVYAQILQGYGDAAAGPSVLYRAGRLAFETERPERAVAHLERLVTEHPGSHEAAEGRLLLGRALAAAGRPVEGEALLRRVADANAQNVLGAQAHTALGRMALDVGDYEKAIELLRKRLELGATSEGNDAVLLLLAQCYRAANQPQEAQDALRDIIRFFPDTASAPAAYVELTELLERTGRRDDALRIALEATQRHPGHPEVLLQYARMRELAGDSHGAAEALLAAEEAGAAEPQVLLTAGNQFRKAGYTRDAEDAYRRLAAAFPGTPQAIAGNVGLAQIAMERGEAARALQLAEDMAQLAQNTPQETEVLLALGNMYGELGLLQRAAQAYRDAAAASAEPEVLARAAVALYATDAWAEGAEVARRVDSGRLRPETAFAFLMAHGRAMLRADSARGAALMQQAWSDYPEQRDLESAERLVDTYLALDRFNEAVAVLDELSGKVTPANADFFRHIAIACGDHAMQHDDYAAAAGLYRKAIDVSSRETQALQWARFQLANALHAQGSEAESRPLFEFVAASASQWSTAAQLRLDYQELNRRLRTGPASVPGAEG